MKTKFANDRFSYVFTPRVHGNVLAWVKPGSMPERSKRANESIMRWEDDGGQIIEIDYSTPGLIFPIRILSSMKRRGKFPDSHEQCDNDGN